MKMEWLDLLIKSFSEKKNGNPSRGKPYATLVAKKDQKSKKKTHTGMEQVWEVLLLLFNVSNVECWVILLQIVLL